MHFASQSDPHSVIASGFRLANYVRLGLGITFTLSVLGNLTEMERIKTYLIQSEILAVGVLIVLGLVGVFLMRGNRTPGHFVRVSAFIDMTMVGLVMMAGSQDGQAEGYNMAVERNLYAVYIIFLISSALLGSARITFLLSVYGSGLFVSAILLVHSMGAEFGTRDNEARMTIGLAPFISAAVFIPVCGGILAAGIRIQQRLSKIAMAGAQENKALVESLQDQQKKIAEYARNLDGATARFQTFIQETTGRIETQAAALEEANAVTEELTASSSQTADTVQSQSRGIEQMATQSTELKGVIASISSANQNLTESSGEALASMETVQSTVEGTTETLGRLESAFSDVSKITEIMNEIAEKTNLLSLNAAIEAARAGDSGRGFAVVADEVSKLADYTGQNVRKIATIVNESMSTIDAARKQSDEAVRQTSTQKERTRNTNQQVEQTSQLLKQQATLLESLIRELETQRGRATAVLNGSREQIDGQKELARTMESLDREITEINEASKGLLSGIEDISQQAANLRNLSES
ncbi:MAG: hypothetical protein KDK23_03855 [Leptospiraceae bacterium]|nr:hypothetical protein [Leptospiraceae bacterium]